MTTRLKVHVNEDDALLFWSVPEPIAGCRGFAIERKRTTPSGEKTQAFLLNRTGFESENLSALAAEGQAAMTKPSTQWPFQRFNWTDHEVDTGDTVSYRVVPIVRGADGKLRKVASKASEWSEARTLGARSDSRFRPFFNRGFVMSQFMARYLAEKGLSLPEFKRTIRKRDDVTIRKFLSGDLRLALLEQLELARKGKGQIHAALFELSDEELIDALCAVGKRAHVVLANGSVQKGKAETSAQARKRDENKEARKRLRDAGVDVQVADRFLSPGALGHNKFLVRSDAKGKPQAAWTGSTNWAPTGLCTQVNNGLLIEDAEIASGYRRQWDRLRAAASGFPDELLAANGAPTLTGDDLPGRVRTALWFTRTRKGVDLAALEKEVMAAREGILFLMFMPGASGLFKSVSARATEPGLYVRGVVSELPNGRDDESAVDVNLIDGSKSTSLHLDIIQPEGAAHPYANFAEEVTRKEFLANVGHAIIHSKVVVIDPFGVDPVVITGSHNFSISASAKNDENFIIVKGDHDLAEAYAVNILGAYAHYRWRAFVSQVAKPFNGLRDNDKWQAPKLARERAELRFWGA